MAAYEAMLILRPELNEDEQKAVVAQLEQLLKSKQTQLESSRVFGRRQLAYPINKCSEGLYHLMHFSTQENTAVAELKRACAINEKVLRALIIRRHS